MNPNDKENLYKLRHSAEHVFAQAVTDLYPGKVQLGVAHISDEGFSNDAKWSEPLSENDFPKIEKKMQEIIKADLPITQKEVSVEEAKEMFKNNPYKLEWIDQHSAEGKTITVYWTGDQYVDLCKGPHVERTSEIGVVKLLSLSGAYWRGDEKNEMLTRVYGTAFASQAELDEYLAMVEEAKKRDHKVLGVKLDLFTFSDLVGSGLPLWTPKGALMRNLLNNYVQELRGYDQVEIPHITKKDLYEKSGHWAKFADELFKIKTREGHLFAMKPMNCPHHTQIYARHQHSYKELPQRYANTTMVYRDEQSGELSGLSRVRCITQDDAHIFCRESQSFEEANKIWDIIETFYGSFGFDKLRIRLSLHDPKHMEKYLGDEKQWEFAEKQLKEMLEKRNAEYFEGVGEAAFYGPKLDFMAKDSLGREWQVATVQIDRNMPNSFDLTCVNENGEKERIVMLHAAIMGSIERFMSVLIEHFAGAFPVWLSPVQAEVISISEKFNDYAKDVMDKLKAAGIRVQINADNETLGNKIRKAQGMKIPYMLVVGEKEKGNNSVNVRSRDGKNLGEVSVEEFVKMVKEKVESKAIEV